MINARKEIPRRYPELGLALVRLGGTTVLGILVTMDGKQGVQILRLVVPQRTILIHSNDYNVFTSQLADCRHESQAAGLADRVYYWRHAVRTPDCTERAPDTKPRPPVLGRGTGPALPRPYPAHAVCRTVVCYVAGDSRGLCAVFSLPSQAFGWHDDLEAVFIIQVQVYKEHTLRQNTVNPLPRLGTASSGPTF